MKITNFVDHSFSSRCDFEETHDYIRDTRTEVSKRGVRIYLNCLMQWLLVKSGRATYVEDSYGKIICVNIKSLENWVLRNKYRFSDEAERFLSKKQYAQAIADVLGETQANMSKRQSNSDSRAGHAPDKALVAIPEVSAPSKEQKPKPGAAPSARNDQTRKTQSKQKYKLRQHTYTERLGNVRVTGLATATKR